MHPISLAIRYHKELFFIHPFADGNGRVARLAMNGVLLQNKYLQIDIDPTRINHYQQSINDTYIDSNAFYRFMLAEAIISHFSMLKKVKISSDIDHTFAEYTKQ
jgi:fido (protein-threonine AMPylation protein)